MGEIINGIQQIGIGVGDTKAVFNWYRKYLGFDILLFRDEATASLMTKYTADKPQRREAFLSLNMRGGGGLEIWQFKNRIPNPPETAIMLGDLGINAMVLRSAEISKTHKTLSELELEIVSEIKVSATQAKFFFFVDPWGNRVEVVQDSYTFKDTVTPAGGVLGAVLGVSNMEKSIDFYASLLGYNQIVIDEIIYIEPGHKSTNTEKFRKVVLKHERPKFGGFGALLGPTQLELLQALDRQPNKIFKNRLWGDLGYIHICFDVHGMESLRKKAAQIGHAFTVDSANSFDMGDAAGHFSYVEDPDGTLIEFVETHKVPILKAMGIYLNLKKRNPEKPLPRWLVHTLKLHRVKKDL